MAHQAPTSDPPKCFNILPNELLKAILVKVDIQKLFPLRLMSSRWNAVIEKICREKKILIIMSSQSTFAIGPFVAHYFARNSENPVFLKIVPLSPSVDDWNVVLLTEDFVRVVMKLFPEIQKFLFEPELANRMCCAANLSRLLTCWSSSLKVLSLEQQFPRLHYPVLCNHINNLKNLKRLNMGTYSLNDPNLLSPTFGRLEYLSTFGLNENTLLTAISHLGPNCSSLFLRARIYYSHAFVNRIAERNARLVKNLKFLRISIDSLDALNFVCERFVSLEALHLVANQLLFDWFAPFDELANLQELTLYNCALRMYRINLGTLAREHPPPLINIRTLSLIHCSAFRFPLMNENFNGFTNFCLDLSSIFSNVERLAIQIRPAHVEHVQLITDNVGMFGRLRSHRVWV